jgi:hypothetical protein
MRHDGNSTRGSSTDEDALARLADGTLPEEASSELRARVERSPQLQARLREQERSVALARATLDTAAPASLRTAIDSLIEPDRGARRETQQARWRPWLAMPAVLAIAAVIAVIVLVRGGTATPTVEQTTHLALAAATFPAPAANRPGSYVLAVHASGTGGIPFPSYVGHTGWKASGLRRDTLQGRQVTTVFYRASSGARVGYSIVGGNALKVPAGRTWTVDGTRYILRAGEKYSFVTWRRDGHTCVIAGRSVTSGTLLRLATNDEDAT